MRRSCVGNAWRTAGPALILLAAWAAGPAAPAAAGEPKAKAKAREHSGPTFTRDVAPILQKKCQNCHRRGQVGPFALQTYEQARKRADDIVAVVEDRQMPPWKPAPGVGPKLQHDQSLTLAEVAVLQAWAEAGAPKGDESQMPPEPRFAEGWTLGTPDMVLEPAEDFALPADGPDTYRCFILPTNLPKDTAVTAIEFLPGNPRVVHHMSTYLDTKGYGRKLDEMEPGPGYTSFTGPGFDPDGEIGFWAAGSVPHHLPDGIGYLLPRRCDVILQIHYHPSGKPEVDRTRLGVYFARRPIKRVVHWNDASCYDFRLPAGKSNIEVKAQWFVPVDVEALAVAPHMHALGKDFQMTVTYPDGHSRDLIHIPDWDPNWQGSYFFEKPIPLPKASVVKVVAHYDNSDHARNPNQPPKPVRYGHSVADEMCVGYIAVVKKGQDLTKPGATDDLFDIFQKQRLNFLKRQLIKQRR